MRTITTLASLLLAGCSTITTMDGRPVEAADAACDVRVYQTYQAAIRQGPIDELCVITGTSSMSFVHTSATAIEKHKGKACSCGANAVYVQSRHDTGGLDLATVTMVAFRYRK
ncbi:MAG TPA: hypothetical protein PKL62_15205 [Accumulibacter sp.]|uniref:hypothetical protein n=1 Tax=Accumulibacter sp. TaxID=2053492 RepID=UPI002B59A96D|nr:hypothetical protein [Accumulibacter sp.]HNN85490.1 hypothetical protein [Accumulibacter sp.]